MNNYGAQQFQEEREDLICNLIQRACELLSVEEILINARTVSEKISYLFENEKIDMKFYVKEQTIGRNPVYNRIWKNYQKKQQIQPNNKRKNYSKLDEFELRDKLDILQQEYVELSDENKFLVQQNIDLKKELESLITSKKTHVQIQNNIQTTSSKHNNILQLINDILSNGPVAIVKKETDDEVIIKNYKNSNQERVILTIDEWKASCG